MKHRPTSRRRRTTKSVLRLLDLEHARTAVLNTLTSPDAQRGYRHAIDEFVDWYCSEPRLACAGRGKQDHFRVVDNTRRNYLEPAVVSAMAIYQQLLLLGSSIARAGRKAQFGGRFLPAISMRTKR